MTRRERLERKLEKRHEWADKASTRSAAGFDAAYKSIEHIPPGQPILVGHHSERHHRRDLERHDSKMRNACEQQDLAKHHEQKAAGLESQLETTIFSDDPDAIEALKAKAANIEAECDLMKRANAAHRKHKGAPGWASELGIEKPEVMEQKAAELFKVCPYERQPFPGYALTNRRAEIRRIGERIKSIGNRQKRASMAEASGGILIEGADYVRVTFAEKPERSIIDALKSAGFHWSSGSWCGYREKIPTEVFDLIV